MLRQLCLTAFAALAMAAFAPRPAAEAASLGTPAAGLTAFKATSNAEFRSATLLVASRCAPLPALWSLRVFRTTLLWVFRRVFRATLSRSVSDRLYALVARNGSRRSRRAWWLALVS